MSGPEEVFIPGKAAVWRPEEGRFNDVASAGIEARSRALGSAFVVATNRNNVSVVGACLAIATNCDARVRGIAGSRAWSDERSNTPFST